MKGVKQITKCIVLKRLSSYLLLPLEACYTWIPVENKRHIQKFCIWNYTLAICNGTSTYVRNRFSIDGCLPHGLEQNGFCDLNTDQIAYPAAGTQTWILVNVC